MRSRFFWVCLLSVLLLLSSSSESVGYTVKYDFAFRRWGEWYFPFDDWKYFKAQGIAESSLKPDAVSYCGAQGLMQIMPKTAIGLGVKNPWDPEESIQGGIKYDHQMDGIFKGINQPERRKFIFAGYNCGPGNLKKAKTVANSDVWDTVAKSLPLITGKHSSETIGYVKRIYNIMANL